MTKTANLEVKKLPGRFYLPALSLALKERYPFLLESTAASNGLGQYDILFAFPQESIKKEPDNHEDFLPRLNQAWQENKEQYTDSTLPFTGGWFLFLSYELANEIEPSLDLRQFDHALPVAQATRVPAAIIYEHDRDITYLIAEKPYAYTIEYMLNDLESLGQLEPDPKSLSLTLTEEAPSVYLDGIKKVLNYIRDGDVFQVNLSREWKSEQSQPIDVATAYQNLRLSNPAPFSGLVRLGDTYVLSSSPERLVRVKDDVAETRPIAGTRPRSADERDDRALQEDLIENLKERAEHVMLIDLERNDLGRICVPGSIEVNELMAIESYAHVHHIVSNIRGKLSPDVQPGNIIAAVFPGGTITGCPKVRCMEIISELEQSPRGAYTGAMGYLNRNGDMDLNILIRTIVVNQNKISMRAGAGLVADSIPEKELDETRAKAKGMAMALSG